MYVYVMLEISGEQGEVILDGVQVVPFGSG